MTTSLLWFRRDLRLDDNPALQAALRAGAVVPIYVHAPDEQAPWQPGAASQAWLRRSLRQLDASLQALGSRLVLRRGPSLAALEALLAETGATAVHWNRQYEPQALLRDNTVTRALRARGIEAQGHRGALWAEPWDIQTQAGGPYRVFTPFWRALRAQLETLPAPDAPPVALPAIALPRSEALDVLLPAPVPRWDRAVLADWEPGEAGAASALEDFVGDGLSGYAEARDRPDRPGTSRLSPHLHFGEISPRRILATLHHSRPSTSSGQAGPRPGVDAVARRTDASRTWAPAFAGATEGSGAMKRSGAVEVSRTTDFAAATEAFLRQLGWREFAVHLLHHFPHTPTRNLDARFDRFAWAAADEALLEAWRRGRTGVPLVDAGMQELWHTGWMHNRVRMVAASFLVKHLRVHWLHGARWFWDTLVDADLANNTLGWQWVAGTGADAAPYFRVFNPLTQAEKFDPQQRYRQRWLPPGYRAQPIVDLAQARAAALAAYTASR
jgi:deoxyribodipyrimidine photo-lyase